MSVATISSNESTIVELPRTHLVPIVHCPAGDYGHKFPGAVPFIKNKKAAQRRYIDFTNTIDEQWIFEKDNINKSRNLFHIRRSTIQAVEWDWVNYLKFESNHNATQISVQYNGHLKQLEKNLLQWLIDVKMWNGPIELVIGIIKLWIYLSKNTAAVLCPDRYIMFCIIRLEFMFITCN